MHRRPDEHPLDNDPENDPFDEQFLLWFITLVDEANWEDDDDAAHP